MPFRLVPRAALGILLALPAFAAEKHVHGAGTLNVVVEGDTVSIELSAPAESIVGFEHAPATPADKAALAKAVEMLKDGAALFVLPPAAGCRLEEAKVDSGLLAETKPSGGGEAHADFDADYLFRCAQPGKIDGIDVALFARFPQARELDVQAVTPKGQIARELTPKTARLKF